MLLIIDANNMAYRALYSVSLSYKGVDTSVTYGSLMMVTALLRKFQPSAIVACFDGGTPQFRKDLFPEYKAHRHNNPEERDWEDIYRQIDELCYVAYPIHGIMTLRADGIEADDLMARASWLSQDDRQIIVTTDDDLLQCVDTWASVYNPSRDELYTEENMPAPGWLHLLYKMLCGDSSDNVPGVPSIGPKTAEKVVQYMYAHCEITDPYNYDYVLKELNDLPLNSRQRHALQDVGKDGWEALYEVMDLHLDRTGADQVIANTEWAPADPGKIRRYYFSHGFISLLGERCDRLYARLGKPAFESNTE